MNVTVNWWRSLIFVALMMMTTLLCVQGAEFTIHRTIPANSYKQLNRGYVYTTESGEPVSMELYSDSEFVIECDGEIPADNPNGLEGIPQTSYFNFKQTVTCERFIVLIGYPYLNAPGIVQGNDIVPFNNIFGMIILGLVLMALWFCLCFVWKR